MKLILTVTALLSFAAYSAPQVELRATPQAPYGQYIKQVLDTIYQRAGYDISYINVPFVREVGLAEKSQLAGVLARDIIIAEHHPALIRLDVPLFSYDVIQFSNRQVCGECNKQQLNIVAYPRGGKIYQEHINNLPAKVNKIAIGGIPNLIKMIEIGRVDAVIMSDILVTDALRNKPNIIATKLETRFDYHYLAPAYASLKQPLQQALKELEQSGQLAQLKRKYGIK